MALAGNSLSLKSLDPRLRAAAPLLLKAAPLLGARSVKITSAKRSRAQQEVLYRNYLAGKSRFPAAKPGTSKHELGLAVDIVTSPESVLPLLGAWWNAIGGRWFSSDPIHFEI